MLVKCEIPLEGGELAVGVTDRALEEQKRRGGGVTKQKMEKDIKEWQLKEVRPITGFSVAFKDAWDRWQLQTISRHRAASSQEEIRDSTIQACFLSDSCLLSSHMFSCHPPPDLEDSP